MTCRMKHNSKEGRNRMKRKQIGLERTEKNHESEAPYTKKEKCRSRNAKKKQKVISVSQQWAPGSLTKDRQY